jgi:phosphoribosyl-ATP pyrophosphohydrolase/phosphoribosyl-AMP cyclohydrolase/histidinol dehydrogenase
MNCLPYPSFVKDTPVSEQRLGLTAVGRCRIHPASYEDAYSFILNLTIQQANETDDKKLQKKYMKQSVALTHTFLQTALQLDVSVVDVEVVLPAEDVIRSNGCLASCFLDAGCQTVVVDTVEALDAARLPSERLMLHSETVPIVTEEMKELCTRYSVLVTSDVNDAMALAEQHKEMVLSLDVNSSQWQEDDVLKLVQHVNSLKHSSVTVALIDPSPSLLGRCYASCIRSDRPDGLFTTVVCSRQGIALGLVYSNTDSIIAALECGRGVYYSRSRQGLWRKGDTSGHFQTLHRLDVDCDGDALRFTVTQNTSETTKPPAFCHLETYTCWGVSRGLRHLEETLQERMHSAPEGSYTKRLFEDEQLLRDKLVEEAQELAEADTSQHVAEELADVLYFAMTRAAKAGVTLDQAVEELDRRSRKVTRRPGDSKAFRIAAGQAILDKKEKE